MSPLRLGWDGESPSRARKGGNDGMQPAGVEKDLKASLVPQPPRPTAARLLTLCKAAAGPTSA